MITDVFSCLADHDRSFATLIVTTIFPSGDFN
jgi:hypothetical protein